MKTEWERLHDEAMNTHRQKRATVKIGLPSRPKGDEVQKVGSQGWNYEGSSEETQAIKNKKNTIRVDIAKGKNMGRQGKETTGVPAGATQQVAPATARAAPQPPPQKKPDVIPNAVQKLVSGEIAAPVAPLQPPPVAPPIATALEQAAPVAAVAAVAAPPVVAAEIEELKREIEELKKQPHPTPDQALPDQGEETSDKAPLPPPPDPQAKKTPTQAILVGESRAELAEDMATRIHVLNRKSQWVDFSLAFVSLLVSIALLIVLMRI